MTDKYTKPLNGLDRYAVVGNPIAHSKSPSIHEAFAKQTGQDISYERILSPLDGFEASVLKLIEQGYKGANVTVPFKFEAYSLCDFRYPEAISAQAVNTLIFENGRIDGQNTDGVGLRRDIEQNLGFEIAGKSILILGAGGAAHGVLNSLAGAARITIANRTLERALELVMGIQDCEASRFDELNVPYDIIINATSTGLTGEALPLPNVIFNKENCLAYDMMYGRETPFMKQARDNGAQVADGLGMLVEQAAEAFYLWRGVRPETQSVIQQMRNLA
jgi:shikimate dehydrogenase